MDPSRPFRRPNIVVIGSSEATGDEEDLARQLGSAIAVQRWNLVCGGRGGVMRAAAAGFRAARVHPDAGCSVGLLPGADFSEANEFLDVVIPTGLGLARNALVALAGDVVLAVGGFAGTLSEMAMAWQFDKPIGVLGQTGWAGQLRNVSFDSRRSDSIESLDDVEAAILWVERRLRVDA